MSDSIHCILDERTTNISARNDRPYAVTLCGRKVQPGISVDHPYPDCWEVGRSFYTLRSGSWHRPCKRCAAVAAKTFEAVKDMP